MRRTLLAMLAVLAGCSAASKAARIAEKALERGDVATAATAYAQACDLSDEKGWCEQAQTLFGQLKSQVIAAAQPVCLDPSQPKRCLELLAPARTIHDDSQLAALADIAGAAWLASCQQIQTPSAVEAVVRHRCVASLEADVNTERYRAAAAVERQALAAFVTQEAERTNRQGYSAQALGLAQLARCLAPAASTTISETALRLALGSRLAVPVSVAGDGLANERMVTEVVRSVAGNRITLTGAGEVGLRLSLHREAGRHDFFDEPMSQEYVVRREVYTNPDWVRLERRRVQLESATRDARAEERLAEDRCRLAQSDHSRAQNCSNCDAARNEQWQCSRARSIEQGRREVSSSLDDVARQLRGTPQELVNEVRDTYRWVRRTHRWQLPYSVTLTVAGSGFAPQQNRVSFTYESQEQPGFDPAGIREMRAAPPDMRHFDGQAQNNAAASFRTWVNDGLATLSAQRAARCAAHADVNTRQECEAGAAFLRGVDPGAYMVAQVERQAEAKGASRVAACATP
jgi:hypothetical protein